MLSVIPKQLHAHSSLNREDFLGMLWRLLVWCSCKLEALLRIVDGCMYYSRKLWPFRAHVLAAVFVSQDKYQLQDIVRREMTLFPMTPTASTVLSVLFDFCIYLKDRIIMPFLYKPWRFPFLLIHYTLKHDKLHQF